MVTDVNTSSVVANDSSNQVNTGDLRVILRRDTLVAKSSAADTSGDKVPVGNATFNLDYEGYGSQTVTTSSGNGSTLIQPIDGLPLGKDVTVTMTQDTAAAGYEKFEATPPVQFTYNSNVGLVLKSFDSVGAITPQINPDSDTPDTDIDEGVMLMCSPGPKRLTCYQSQPTVQNWPTLISAP
ncbi:hypothetical protein [Lacticaseibacillus manihotivorans]|uniref:Uncharacterized protein n=1 Tax=Lacticaseibacillus manihotivorans TaxID=88233 RepID=A0A5P8JQ29_9LACO|nr:hypothetical protein [Lacticaseibacillus manihotivorans]QFQ90884.1 hypothetical protein LM010_05360 [Lacticaseibacillus manihotivorans]